MFRPSEHTFEVLRRSALPLALALSCACADATDESGPTPTSGTPAATGPGALGPRAKTGNASSSTPLVSTGPAPAESDPNALLGLPEQTSHEFGKVLQGALLRHDFELASAGKSDLRILQVKPSCGCTVPRVLVEGTGGSEPVEYTYGDPLAPGSRVRLSALMDTSNKQGHIKVAIQIYTNDPTGLSQLDLVADIDPFLIVSPPVIELGRVMQGEEKSATLDVETTDGTAVALSLVGTSGPTAAFPPGISAELEAQNPDTSGRASHWRLTAVLGPDTVEGRHVVPLVLETDVEVQGAEPRPDGSLPRHQSRSRVVAQVLGPLSVKPRYLGLGIIQPGQVVSRTAQIRANDPALDLESLEFVLTGMGDEPLAWPDAFSVDLRPAVGKPALDVELLVDDLPEDASGSFQGRILVRYPGPPALELEIPFSGACRRAGPSQGGG